MKLKVEEYNHIRNAKLFLSINTPTLLSRFLNVGLFQLQNIINNPDYKHFVIAKKRGGFRDIYSPSQNLKIIQKHLNYYLQAYYLSIKPSEVFGFVINPHYLGKQCNILENAKVHSGFKYLLTIDLEDFFPSIKSYQIKQLFSSSLFGFNEEMSTAFALLCTYNKSLPIGAPTSPVLANFICLGLDNELKNFCKIHNLNYSRYADDLSFSSNQVISQEIKLGLFSVIQQSGFNINTKKVRIRSDFQKQIVTGVTVNEFPNVNRVLLKRIRAMIHDLQCNGLYEASMNHFKLQIAPTDEQQKKFVSKLYGYINFIGQIRGKSDPKYSLWKTKVDNMLKII